MYNQHEGQHPTRLRFYCVWGVHLHDEKVKKTIVAELQHAKYFSVIVDTTPDMLHIDQWTFILRFVSEEGKGVEKASLA